MGFLELGGFPFLGVPELCWIPKPSLAGQTPVKLNTRSLGEADPFFLPNSQMRYFSCPGRRQRKTRRGPSAWKRTDDQGSPPCVLPTAWPRATSCPPSAPLPWWSHLVSRLGTTHREAGVCVRSRFPDRVLDGSVWIADQHHRLTSPRPVCARPSLLDVVGGGEGALGGCSFPRGRELHCSGPCRLVRSFQWLCAGEGAPYLGRTQSGAHSGPPFLLGALCPRGTVL